MQEHRVPFEILVLVCTHSREGSTPSCANRGEAAQLRERLKDKVPLHGWQGRVRISQTGCLGQCGVGVNVFIEPHHLHFSGCRAADAEAILARVSSLLGEP